MWHHQDRMSRAENISTRYEEVIRADSELKSLYLSWPQALRDTNTVPSDRPLADNLPAELMPAMLLMSTAQKVCEICTYQ
jgi:hypothetical protein